MDSGTSDLMVRLDSILTREFGKRLPDLVCIPIGGVPEMVGINGRPGPPETYGYRFRPKGGSDERYNLWVKGLEGNGSKMRVYAHGEGEWISEHIDMDSSHTIDQACEKVCELVRTIFAATGKK
jgi:hypothetical protein